MSKFFQSFNKREEDISVPLFFKWNCFNREKTDENKGYKPIPFYFFGKELDKSITPAKEKEYP